MPAFPASCDADDGTGAVLSRALAAVNADIARLEDGAGARSLPTVNVRLDRLGGDYGLAIIASGYPQSQAVSCDASAPIDAVDETLSAGSSGLAYDAATGLYTYVWKTERSWANTCRKLTLRLIDGSDHVATFKFVR